MGITRIRPELQMNDGDLPARKIAPSLAGDGIERDETTGIIGVKTDGVTLEIDTDEVKTTSAVTVGGNSYNGPSELCKVDPYGKLPDLDGSKLKNLPPTAHTHATIDLSDVGGVVNVADGLVKLDGTGKLPGLDGSQLTNLPGGSGGAWVKVAEETLAVAGSSFTQLAGLDLTLHRQYKLMLMLSNQHALSGGNVRMTVNTLAEGWAPWAVSSFYSIASDVATPAITYNPGKPWICDFPAKMEPCFLETTIGIVANLMVAHTTGSYATQGGTVRGYLVQSTWRASNAGGTIAQLKVDVTGGTLRAGSRLILLGLNP